MRSALCDRLEAQERFREPALVDRILPINGEHEPHEDGG
jgi:hypothetical protein